MIFDEEDDDDYTEKNTFEILVQTSKKEDDFVTPSLGKISRFSYHVLWKQYSTLEDVWDSKAKAWAEKNAAEMLMFRCPKGVHYVAVSWKSSLGLPNVRKAMGTFVGFVKVEEADTSEKINAILGESDLVCQYVSE